MDEAFNEEMLRLMANPYKIKKQNNVNKSDDILHRNMILKFKNYNISKKKFDNILILIETYLNEQSIVEFVEDLIDNIIKNVSPDPGYIEIYDERRNPRTLRKSRTK